MPYIDRKKGKIVSLFSVPQANEDGEVLRDAEGKPLQEFLPDDHPEVIEFCKEHPMPETKPLTPKEIEQQHREWQRLDVEHKSLRDLMVSFSITFSELEMALGNLLYEILNIQPKSSHIGHAIYYTPTSFEARRDIVNSALIQLIKENEKLADVKTHSDVIFDKINQLNRKRRNPIAHGSPITLNINGKVYARITSPAFDILRVGSIIQNNQIPGFSVQDMKIAVAQCRWCIERIDDINRLITAYHEDDDETYQKKFARLDKNLQAKQYPH